VRAKVSPAAGENHGAEETSGAGGISAASLQQGTAYARIVDHLRARGKKVRETRSGQQAMAQCPAHDDHDPSLTIYRRPGRAKVICWPGCDDRDVLAALGLSVGDLYDDPKRSAGAPCPHHRSRSEPPQSPLDRTRARLLEWPGLGGAIARRAVQHAILEADPAYWWRRAEQFDQVGMPECDLIATNCRNHAQLLSWLLPAGREVPR
jgi:hypothetical protein